MQLVVNTFGTSLALQRRPFRHQVAGQSHAGRDLESKDVFVSPLATLAGCAEKVAACTGTVDDQRNTLMGLEGAAEQHALANALLGRTDLPRIVDTQRSQAARPSSEVGTTGAATHRNRLRVCIVVCSLNLAMPSSVP